MLRASVAIALALRQEVIEVELPEGSTVADALAAARVHELFPEIDRKKVGVGIWSRPASLETALREGDRVEIYRRLEADPKAMRRARARLRSSTRSRSGP
jgi:putative ubiquitin-RnfH superfamily antitoxin RatB of RatAB toxin-antitoxin module